MIEENISKTISALETQKPFADVSQDVSRQDDCCVTSDDFQAKFLHHIFYRRQSANHVPKDEREFDSFVQ